MDKILSKEVSFELAKILKEKGFNNIMKQHYTKEKFIDSDIVSSYNWNNFTDMEGNKYYYSAPTIGEVIDWLYDRFEIWISVHQYKNTFSWRIVGLEFIDDFKSPIEAYKHAIKYCLENLL